MNLRAQKLGAEPICEWRDPSGERCLIEATDVDHIVPQKEWPAGRYDWGNLRSMCADHHLIRHGKRPRRKIDMATGWAE